MNNKAFNCDFGYVLCNENVEVKGKEICLPVYMIMFLKQEKHNENQIIKLDISKLI